jgi:hypothetical protein
MSNNLKLVIITIDPKNKKNETVVKTTSAYSPFYKAKHVEIIKKNNKGPYRS